MSKLQKKPSALKRGHPPLQNMNFYKFVLLLWVIFALLDPDPDSGSTGPIESGSNPDPKPWIKKRFIAQKLAEPWRENSSEIYATKYMYIKGKISVS
jgi:hypothetical protein